MRRHMLNSMEMFRRINIQREHIINFYLFFSGTEQSGSVCAYSNELIHFYALPKALSYNFNDYRKGERHALNLHEMVAEVLWGVFFEVVASIRKITFIRLNTMCAHHGNNCKSIDNFKETGKRDAMLMMMTTMTTFMMSKTKRRNRKMVIKR